MKSGAIPSSICKGSPKSWSVRALPLTSTNNCDPYWLSLQCLMLKGIITHNIRILVQFLTTKSVLEIKAINLKVTSRLQTKGREVTCYPHCLYTETHSDDIRRPCWPSHSLLCKSAENFSLKTWRKKYRKRKTEERMNIWKKIKIQKDEGPCPRAVLTIFS
jgi:hypothetical protein